MKRLCNVIQLNARFILALVCHTNPKSNHVPISLLKLFQYNCRIISRWIPKRASSRTGKAFRTCITWSYRESSKITGGTRGYLSKYYISFIIKVGSWISNKYGCYQRNYRWANESLPFLLNYKLAGSWDWKLWFFILAHELWFYNSLFILNNTYNLIYQWAMQWIQRSSSHMRIR